MEIKGYSVWCQGGPANNWRYETLVEPPATIYVLPVPGPSKFIRILEPCEGSTTYVRYPQWEQFDFERIYYSEAPICDFCNSPEIAWDYDAADFEVPLPDGRIWHSYEGWAACDPCSTLIEADDRTGLLARSLARFSETGSGFWDVTGCGMVQEGFFENREGPRKAI